MAGKPPQYFTDPPRPTELPAISGMGNKYQSKCSDALLLESKGRYGSFHLWINVWWQVKLLLTLTRAIPERLRDVLLVVKCYTNVRLLYFLLCIRPEIISDHMYDM